MPPLYPETFQNRTRDQATAELVEYVGGVGQTDALARAGKAWDAAVRDFNSVAWRFNIKVQDITLDGAFVSGTGVIGQPDYQLTDKFRSPIRCQMLDAQGLSRTLVNWFPYNEWLVWRRNQLTPGPLPLRYTARNVHETGIVTFDPRPIAPLTYPTARIVYVSWIDLQPTGNGFLDVPPDVDEAVFSLAVAKLISKNKRFGDESEQAFKEAADLRLRVERNHRVYGEITGWGANG